MPDPRCPAYQVVTCEPTSVSPASSTAGNSPKSLPHSDIAAAIRPASTNPAPRAHARPCRAGSPQRSARRRQRSGGASCCVNAARCRSKLLRALIAMLRDRKFADPSLEGTGFELPVPRCALHRQRRGPGRPPDSAVSGGSLNGRLTTPIGWWAGNCSADPPRGSLGPTRTRPRKP